MFISPFYRLRKHKKFYVTCLNLCTSRLCRKSNIGHIRAITYDKEDCITTQGMAALELIQERSSEYNTREDIINKSVLVQQ